MSATNVTKADIIKALDAIGSLLLTPPMIAYSAFVSWKLWTWFAVPNGLPVLSYASVGVFATLWSLWTAKVSLYKDPREGRSLLKVQAEMFVARTLGLAVGYAFTWWGAP
ncbi:MAG: hypothetical protein ACK5X3_04715 [Pseudomonadota bacterium]